MSRLILLNKPFGVLCQFSGEDARLTLRHCVRVPGVYPAGRLDTDSEGLLLLTDDGAWQHRISDPAHKLPKVYLAQVEGRVEPHALVRLRAGLDLGDFTTMPCEASVVDAPDRLWPRDPPIRTRVAIPTTWLEIVLREGKNRQVRRMTARVGHPTLRLVRIGIGPFRLGELAPGQWRDASAQELGQWRSGSGFARDLKARTAASRSAPRQRPESQGLGGWSVQGAGRSGGKRH